MKYCFKRKYCFRRYPSQGEKERNVTIVYAVVYKVGLRFESLDEILKCDHSNEQYFLVCHAVLFVKLFKMV